MSAIPPNASALGSVLQSGAQQTEQTRQADSDRNAQADRVRQTAGGSDGVLVADPRFVSPASASSHSSASVPLR